MARLHAPRVLCPHGRWDFAQGDVQELHDPGLPLSGLICLPNAERPLLICQNRSNSLAQTRWRATRPRLWTILPAYVNSANQDRNRYANNFTRAPRSSRTSDTRSTCTSASARNSVSRRKTWRSMRKARVNTETHLQCSSRTSADVPQPARHTAATSSTSGNRRTGWPSKSLCCLACSATA